MGQGPDVMRVLSTRKYKAGYEIREEVWNRSAGGGKALKVKTAYTPSGDWIGDSRWAYRLCKKRGVAPEKSKPDHCVCSIGYSKKDKKWYGWSHRAIYGFGVGSKVKVGDCGFVPANKEEFRKDLENWYSDDLHKNVEFTEKKTGISVYYEIHPKGGGGIMSSRYFHRYPKVWGRGEWKAKNLQDAKQMAIDFARGVS